MQAPEQVTGIAIAGASLPVPEDSSCPEQGSVPLLVVDGEKDPINLFSSSRRRQLCQTCAGMPLLCKVPIE
jgi:poly(3-hydroxybutyrate) depolymerase